MSPSAPLSQFVAPLRFLFHSYTGNMSPSGKFYNLRPYTVHMTPTVGVPVSQLQASLLGRSHDPNPLCFRTEKTLLSLFALHASRRMSFFFQMDSSQDSLVDEKTLFALGRDAEIDLRRLEHALSIRPRNMMSSVIDPPASPDSLLPSSPSFNVSGSPAIFVLWPSPNSRVTLKTGSRQYQEETIKVWTHYFEDGHFFRLDLYATQESAVAASPATPVSFSSQAPPETFVGTIYDMVMDSKVNPVELKWDPAAILNQAGWAAAPDQAFVIKASSLRYPDLRANSGVFLFANPVSPPVPEPATASLLSGQPVLSWADINGGSSDGSPFSSASRAARTQSLYLAEELLEAGVAADDQIHSFTIGLAEDFNQDLRNFTVAVALVDPSITELTSADPASQFRDDTTIVFSAATFSASSVSGDAGEEPSVAIILNSPLVWDGVQNLVVEFAHVSKPEQNSTGIGLDATHGQVLMRRTTTPGVRTLWITTASSSGWENQSYPYSSFAAPPTFYNAVPKLTLGFHPSPQSNCSNRGSLVEVAPQAGVIGGRSRFYCRCQEHFYGTRCQTECKADVQCSGRGVCSSQGQCACNAGYHGLGCEFRGSAPLGMFALRNEELAGSQPPGFGQESRLLHYDPLAATAPASSWRNASWAQKNGTPAAMVSNSPSGKRVMTCLYPAYMLRDLVRSGGKVDRLALSMSQVPKGPLVGFKVSIALLPGNTTSIPTEGFMVMRRFITTNVRFISALEDSTSDMLALGFLDGERLAQLSANNATSGATNSTANSTVDDSDAQSAGPRVVLGSSDRFPPRWLEVGIPDASSFEYRGDSILIRLEIDGSVDQTSLVGSNSAAGFLSYVHTNGDRLLSVMRQEGSEIVREDLPFLPRLLVGSYDSEPPLIQSVYPPQGSSRGLPQPCSIRAAHAEIIVVCYKYYNLYLPPHLIHSYTHVLHTLQSRRGDQADHPGSATRSKHPRHPRRVGREAQVYGRAAQQPQHHQLRHCSMGGRGCRRHR